MRFTYILYDAYDFVHIQLLARSVEAWWCEYGYVLAIVFWNVCQSSWWDCIGSGLYIVGSNQISFRVDTFDSLTNTKSLYYIVVVLIDHSLHREKKWWSESYTNVLLALFIRYPNDALLFVQCVTMSFPIQSSFILFDSTITILFHLSRVDSIRFVCMCALFQ